jgi:nicotinate dehydrogenase subunit B
MEDDPTLEPTESTTDLRMNRREFIKTTGSGLFLYFTIGEIPFLQQEVPGRRTHPSLPTDFNAFLRIGEDGRVSCYTGKIEMGQGPITSLAQMLADELDVQLDAVDMIMGDTDLCPWDMGTFGSLTTRRFGPALRSAGAGARRVLIELASEELKVPQSQLATENGEVFDRTDARRRVSYGNLTKGKKIERGLSEAVITKKPAEFRIMGKSALRTDAMPKVTGEAKYAGDIRLPGMLYARMLRPPAHGAKLQELDLSEAQGVEGAQIVREGDFIAVLHQYPDVAETALSKIKARFNVPASTLDDTNIFDHLLKVAPEGRVVANGGDLAEGKRVAAATVEETYLDGYVAHAPIEPHTAVVTIEGKKATVWASTQTPFGARDEVAKELGFPAKSVRVITPFVGGGFGGKTRNLQVVEAARCARLSGKPVQVAWTRQEEFFYDTFRPAAVVTIASGATEKGRISFWDYHVYFAGERGSQQFYDIPHHNTVVHNASWVGASGSHPFATGAWRAPGNNTNTFARESQIDMMAAKSGIDPVEFRLLNLSDEKMKRVLQAAADKFGWKPMKHPSSRGYGVACGIDAGTYVASIAEVDVDKTTGLVKAKRVVCAQDMGLVINPEGAAMQVEGCITMGLGYALKEHIRFKGGEILDTNFDSYEIPRFSWLPKIETVLIDDKDADPQGGGEPAIVVMGAVVGNAIYDAVGVRLTQLPMSPERIIDGLKKG